MCEVYVRHLLPSVPWPVRTRLQKWRHQVVVHEDDGAVLEDGGLKLKLEVIVVKVVLGPKNSEIGT